MKCLLTILFICLFATVASSQIRLSSDSSIYTFTLQIDTTKNLFDPLEISYIKFKVVNSNYESPLSFILYTRKGILRTSIKAGQVFTISGSVYLKEVHTNNNIVAFGRSEGKELGLFFRPIASSDLEIFARN